MRLFDCSRRPSRFSSQTASTYSKKKEVYLPFNCVLRRGFGAHERGVYGGSERQFLMGKKRRLRNTYLEYSQACGLSVSLIVLALQ